MKSTEDFAEQTIEDSRQTTETPSRRNIRSLTRGLPLFLLLLMPLIPAVAYRNYWGIDTGDHKYLVLVLLLLGAAAVGGACRLLKKRLLLRRRTLWMLLIVGPLCNLIYNPDVYTFPPQLMQASLLTMAAFCFTYAVLRRLALIIWMVFFLLELVQIISLSQYGVALDSRILAEVFEASDTETMGYITLGNVVRFILAMALSYLSFYVVHRFLRWEPRLTLLLWGCAFLFLYLLSRNYMVPRPCNQDCGKWPIVGAQAFFEAAKGAQERNTRIVNLITSLPSPASQPTTLHTLKGNEGVVCILHIGESVRADRLSLNGWKNDTTPWLRQQERLINFPDCISLAGDTCNAFIAILTDARCNVSESRQKELMPTCGSLLDLFAANSFHCYSFWGAGAFNDKNDTKFTRIAMSITRPAEKNYQCDEEPWEQIRQIASCLTPGKNLFLLLNNEGSHMPFHRYNQADPPFTPTSITAFYNDPKHRPEEREKADNAYDNTIHYTDEYIRRIATLLQGHPFIYIYIGDHGEYIGHDGMWMRGTIAKPEDYYATSGCRVPFFILTSPEMESLHPHFGQALTQLRAHSSLLTSHEHIFHTLLGFFGIESPYYNPALDLCTPEARPYSGPHPTRERIENPYMFPPSA